MISDNIKICVDLAAFKSKIKMWKVTNCIAYCVVNRTLYYASGDIIVLSL